MQPGTVQIRKPELAIRLQQIEPHPEPKVGLEQYTIPADWRRRYCSPLATLMETLNRRTLEILVVELEGSGWELRCSVRSTWSVSIWIGEAWQLHCKIPRLFGCRRTGSWGTLKPCADIRHCSHEPAIRHRQLMPTYGFWKLG